MPTTHQRNPSEIRLHGAEAGPFPLSWGQGTMWESINALGPRSRRLNIVGGFSVGRPVGVSDALFRIERCLNRFDVFRLAFDERTGTAFFRGEVRIPVRWGIDSGTPGDAAAQNSELYALPFDLQEPPIRLELIHRGAVVTQVGIVMSHLAFDGAAYRLLVRHLRDAVEGREPSPTCIQNEALIKHEQSATGVRRSDAVIGHWVESATRLPPGCGLLNTTAGAYSVTEIRSRAMAIATQALAVFHNTSTASVLTAALTTMIRRHIDRKFSAMLSVCNNRMLPQLGGYVGQTIGNGLIILPRERSDAEFSMFVKDVNIRAFRAYARARYDSVKWRDVLSGLSERGSATDLSRYFNDVRSERGSWSGLEQQIDDLRKGTREGASLTVVDRRDMSDATFFANLHDAGRDCLITLVCDDDRTPPADAALLLKDLEAFLVEQALAC